MKRGDIAPFGAVPHVQEPSMKPRDEAGRSGRRRHAADRARNPSMKPRDEAGRCAAEAMGLTTEELLQ